MTAPERDRFLNLPLCSLGTDAQGIWSIISLIQVIAPIPESGGGTRVAPTGGQANRSRCMKSRVRLVPGKPEITLYWSEPDESKATKPLLRGKRRSRNAWSRHEIEDLDDWEEDSISNHWKGHASPR
jgi:hypothetical protein